MVFSFQAWINNSICIDQSTEPDEDGLGSRRERARAPGKKKQKPRASYPAAAPCGAEGLGRALQTFRDGENVLNNT